MSSSDGKSLVSSFSSSFGFLMRAVWAALRNQIKRPTFLISGKSKKSSRTVGKSIFITCVPTSSGNVGFLNRLTRLMLSKSFFLASRRKNGQRLHGFLYPYMSLHKISTFRLIRSSRSRSISAPMEVRAEPNAAKIAPPDSRLTNELAISL